MQMMKSRLDDLAGCLGGGLVQHLLLQADALLEAAPGGDRLHRRQQLDVALDLRQALQLAGELFQLLQLCRLHTGSYMSTKDGASPSALQILRPLCHPGTDEFNASRGQVCTECPFTMKSWSVGCFMLPSKGRFLTFWTQNERMAALFPKAQREESVVDDAQKRSKSA